MSNFVIPPLNENPEDDLSYDPIAQAAIARKRQKLADEAAVKAAIDKKAADEEAAKNAAADQRLNDSYISQLNTLAPSEYQIHPQLKEYITNLREGKAREASQERQQNAMYNAFDTIGKARANEWGTKSVDIGDMGDTAQQANATAEAAANTIQAKDLTGHIDMRRQIAEALARKRDTSNLSRTFLKESKFVTEGGKPVMVYNDPNTGESKYFDSNNKPISEEQMITSQKYGMLEGQKIEQEKYTRGNAAKIGTALADYSSSNTTFDNIDRILHKQSNKKLSGLDDVLIDQNVVPGVMNSKGEKVDLPGISLFGYGRVDPKFSGESNELQSAIGLLVASYQKAISGLTVNKEEAIRISNDLEQGKYRSEGEMIRGLKTLKKLLQEDKEAKLNQFGPEARALYLEGQSRLPKAPAPKQSSGSTGSWGDKQSPAQPQQSTPTQKNTVIINTPSGRKTVPKADLDRYLKAGATLAE